MSPNIRHDRGGGEGVKPREGGKGDGGASSEAPPDAPSEALFPVPESFGTDFLLPSPDEFRLFLAAAEGPFWTGPGSLEALSIRSSLGAALFDDEDPARKRGP
ncbi:MAG: hypothetical protein LBQ12_03510 [Deltaproteobacteria bacterium]|jgi:hypothetical protein|nr:hypothetical protein [Deltaproteobacteria bacterium]